MKKQHQKSKGFTLIELMIVVAIIGILAAVAIPKFAEMLRKSKEGATKGSLTNLRSALTIYISDNEGLTPLTYSQSFLDTDLIPVMCPKYMEAIPTAKLGTYHQDLSTIRVVNVSDRTNTTTTQTTDAMGWVYTSASGGAWWVNCTHTDTKNNWITTW